MKHNTTWHYANIGLGRDNGLFPWMHDPTILDPPSPTIYQPHTREYQNQVRVAKRIASAERGGRITVGMANEIDRVNRQGDFAEAGRMLSNETRCSKDVSGAVQPRPGGEI